MRPHSSPPRVHDTPEIESSESERDGRCSPLLGLFSSARGRGKQRERNHDNLEATTGKPVVGAPITRIRTASREGSNVSKGAGGAKLPNFEFEGDRSADARRSTSHNGYKRVASPHVSGNAPVQTHTYHSRGHAHHHSHGQDARSHTRTHVRSRSHAHPARSHTHPQPNHHRAGSPPHPAPNSPLMQSVTAASAASHSTTGTAATNTNTTTGAPTVGGTGSWGRAARTVDWIRSAGVHPPFAFESAASSTASTSGERHGIGGGGVCDGGGSGSDIRDRERERDRERSRRRVVAHARGPASPVRSTGTGVGAGRWEQREIELGLGLTWAPTKIRVREWTPGGVDSTGSGRTGAGAGEVIDGGGGKDRSGQAQALQREREMEKRVREREGARRTRERLAEYELGYMRSRSRTDREITGRFRDVLGTEGFEAFKKCEYYLASYSLHSLIGSGSGIRRA